WGEGVSAAALMRGSETLAGQYAKDRSSAAVRFSLSPRERVGVRGTRAQILEAVQKQICARPGGHNPFGIDILALAPDIVDLAPDIVDLAPDIVDLAPDIVALAPDIVALAPDIVD